MAGDGTPPADRAGAGTDLTAGGLLARNVAFNVAGWVAPAVCAVAALPATARAFGPARFGLLSLAWALVGHLTVLDLGIGRALTQVVAARLGRESPARLARIAWTALPLLAVIALAAAAAWLLAADLLVDRMLRASPAVRADAVRATQYFAVAVAGVVLTAGVRGLLEAGQRFGTINALRVPAAVFTYVGPLLALPFAPPGRELSAGIAVLAAGRGALVVAQAVACWRELPWLRASLRPSRAAARLLLRAGGWLTVSNLANPLLITLDRLVLGGMVSAAAGGYYAAAYEVATKMWIVTGAVFPVLFPAIAAAAAGAGPRASALVGRAARVTLVVLFPMTLVMVLAARSLLAVWVGPAFAVRGVEALQLLALGVFVNGVGQTAFTALQAVGRARVTAVAHLLQLAPFAGALWWVAPRHGVAGVAAVTAFRLTVDAVVMWTALTRAMPAARPALTRAGVYAAGAFAVLATGATAAAYLAGWAVVVLAALGTAAHGAVCWRWLLTDADRAAVRRLLAKARAARRLGTPRPGGAHA